MLHKCVCTVCIAGWERTKGTIEVLQINILETVKDNRFFKNEVYIVEHGLASASEI